MSRCALAEADGEGDWEAVGDGVGLADGVGLPPEIIRTEGHGEKRRADKRGRAGARQAVSAWFALHPARYASFFLLRFSGVEKFANDKRKCWGRIRRKPWR